MTSSTYPWDGQEWQRYCTELLYLHHKGRYQPIPDQDRGDGGLEGFSTDGRGCGYQCHAPNARYGIAQRRDQQVAKIKSTVTKLINNRELLGQLVGTHVVREVRFLFPVCESKELVTTVREQEARLRPAISEHRIVWLAADIVISAHQGDELLSREMAELERTGAAHARLPVVEVAEDAVDQHIQTAADELTGATAKLRERFGDDHVTRLLRLALTDHLRGKELAGHLERHNPQTHYDFERVVAERRTRVQRQSLEGATTHRTLTDLGDELAAAISESVAGVHADDVLQLAQGVIADWLIDCPLGFGAAGMA